MESHCIAPQSGRLHPITRLAAQRQDEGERKQVQLTGEIRLCASLFDACKVFAARNLGRAKDSICRPGLAQLGIEDLVRPKGIEDTSHVTMKRCRATGPVDTAATNRFVKDAQRIVDHVLWCALIPCAVWWIAWFRRHDDQPHLVKRACSTTEGAGNKATRWLPHAGSGTSTREMRAGLIGRSKYVEQGFGKHRAIIPVLWIYPMKHRNAV